MLLQMKNETNENPLMLNASAMSVSKPSIHLFRDPIDKSSVQSPNHPTTASPSTLPPP